MIRDKDDYMLDSFEIYQCNLCQNEYHTKFKCPKCHYIPVKQKVIYSYLEGFKNSRDNR